MPFDSTCQIRRVHIRPDGRAQLDLRADDGTFEWSWFLSSVERGREVLAIALTAIAGNKQVYCTMNDPVQTWSEIVTFGVSK